jgi:hypothetical protein
VLPEFQREFVWKDSQAKGLMNSLFKEYPIGALLTWETTNPPEIKNDAIDEEKHGLFEVLLDGQQRLTVLYMLIENEIPPYYDEDDIKNDPRDLHFNVSTGEFHFVNKIVDRGIEWVQVTEVFEGDISPISIAMEKLDTEDQEEFADRSKHYEQNLNQLKNISNLHLPVETLPKSAGVHQAIDLFDRVNSQGTHLGDPELALAHMSAQWPHIRREMKAKQEQLAERGFEFDLNFYVKTMIGALTETMTYKNVYDLPKEDLVGQWQRLASDDGIFDYVVNVLKNEAHIPTSEYISTDIVLIPFIVFLDKRDKQITKAEKDGFLRWIYAAMMWSRYSGSSDTTVEHDLSLLKTDSPTDRLMQEIRDDRGRIEVKPSDLDGRGKRSRRFFNMVYIITRAQGPVDWKTGAPLKGAYKLESHHIFPKSRLYEIYDSGQSEDRKRVNEIANRAFLTPETNRDLIGDRTPDEYLEEVVDEHPAALTSQFIPEEKELWEVDNYEDFLAKRRKNLADAINDYMEDLEFDETGDGREELEELIENGENVRIEFKETFLYDVYQDQPNKELKSEVAKEIASLANAEGGVVIIGVEDQTKEVTGLNRDLKLMSGKDDFELQLNREIDNRLGHMMATAYTEIAFETVNGDEEVCVIWVDDSPEPVYFEDGNQDEFYARMGSSANPLTMQEAQEYIETHFK